MDDPYSPDIELQRCMDRCEVTRVTNGHVAYFHGHEATFESSDGPSEWTEEMACKTAIFLWCLEQRELTEV